MASNDPSQASVEKKDNMRPTQTHTENCDDIVANHILVDNDTAAIEKQKTTEGEAFFNRLGWKRMTILLIVQAIALGVLALPKAFATLGLVLGVILTAGVGLIAFSASVIVGRVCVKYPHVRHYTDIGHLLGGKWGQWIISFMFVSLLTMTVGSHCLTGAIAFATLTGSDICSILWTIVSAVIMLILGLPPSFTEVAVLGYVDFASIVLAIGVTMIGTGVGSLSDTAKLSPSWTMGPKDGLGVSEIFVAINNIVFAYAAVGAQPSYMAEMHTPKDFIKSSRTLVMIQIIIYTLTGSLIYVFCGQDVESPAILSTSPLLAKIAFGVAIPVIFISGSINITTVGRYIHGDIYKNSITRYINTVKGWVSWIAVVVVVTLFAWLISEAVPVFSELLSLAAALFVSGFSFYIPAIMWFKLLCDDRRYTAKHNILKSLACGLLFLFGVTILVVGVYAVIDELVSKLIQARGHSLIQSQIKKFEGGGVGKPFSCSAK